MQNNLENLEKLKSENKRLSLMINKYKKILNYVCKGNTEVIDNLLEDNANFDYDKFKYNELKIDNKTGKYLINDKNSKDEIDATKFYDIIVQIKSIKDINKGWNLKFSERIKKNKDLFNKTVLKIGVIGNSNKGKSFLLSKLSKIDLPSGTSITTEGLSIKYPDIKEYKNRNIVLLDSAGLETTVLKEEYENKENYDNYKEGEEKEDETQEGQKEEANDISANEDEKQKKGNMKTNGNTNSLTDNEYNYFEEKSREKMITELFLQNYIIYYSDILIIVVGILTYSEQILLTKIVNELEKAKINKTLFIIHNLMSFTKVSQVKNYINNTLLKSATFSLIEQHNINSKMSTETGICYYEKKESNNQKIFHLIYANEGSEAGEYYNEYTLKYLEDSYKAVINLKPFDVIETIKERFRAISNDYFERFEGDISFDRLEKEKIKLNKPETIILKRCLVNELGISKLKANGYEPTFNYYKKGNQIIVRIEAPGNCDFDADINTTGEKTYIKIEGTKNPDKEPTNIKDNIFTNREMGKFSINIPIDSSKYLIQNSDPKIDKKNGIIILYFCLYYYF
jgi:HSP20 family molecular chaperone IbpA